MPLDRVVTVVVDNGSTNPADLALLSDLLDGPRPVHLLFSKRNLGYFAGLDLGVQYLTSLRETWDVIIIGNNDITFPSDLTQILEHYRHLLERWPVVSPALVDDSGQDQNPHVAEGVSQSRRAMWWLYHRSYVAARAIALVANVLGTAVARPENRGIGSLHRSVGVIEQGYGAAYLVGERFLKDYCRLPVLTFMMQEEFFLSELLRHHGSSIYYDPALTIRHHTHGSLGSVTNRRRWELARDAYKVYADYRSAPPAQQLDMLTKSMIPRSLSEVTVRSNC